MAAADEGLRDIDQFFEGQTGPPKFDLTEVHHGIKGFVLRTDFTLTRPAMPLVSSNSNFVDGVATKDVVIDKEANLRARIFLPEIADDCKSQLPVLLYFHGGGFVFLSADSRMFHDFCEDVCKNVKAIVVSIDYRLAPEHRLPSQYEDARIALEWLRLHAERSCKLVETAVAKELEFEQEPRFVSRVEAPADADVEELESPPEPQSVSQAEVSVEKLESAPEPQSSPQVEVSVKDLDSAPELQSVLQAQTPEMGSSKTLLDSESTVESWLISHADFHRIFFVGDSAGGNIVHHLLIGSPPEILKPLNLSGLILIQAAFGGLNRTSAELSLAHELPCSIDLFWKLALPLEADRSHHFCDVIPKLNDLLLDQNRSFPDTLMVVGGRDSMRDWQLLYYETLRRYGTKINLVNYADAFHGFYSFPHHELKHQLLEELAQFVRDR